MKSDWHPQPVKWKHSKSGILCVAIMMAKDWFGEQWGKVQHKETWVASAKDFVVCTYHKYGNGARNSYEGLTTRGLFRNQSDAEVLFASIDPESI
jgi:hypothetical protein